MLKRIWQIGYPLLFYMVAGSLVVEVWERISGSLGLTDGEAQLRQLLITALVSIPVLYGIYRKTVDLENKVRYRSTGRLRDCAVVIAMAVSSCIFVNVLIFLSSMGTVFQGASQVTNVLTSGSLLLQLLCVGIASPVAEELIFRGLSFGRMREYLGFGASALLSALYFGLYHGNLLQGLYAFIAGILMALVYERIGGLGAAVLFHITTNLVSVLMNAFGGGLRIYESKWGILVLSAIMFLIMGGSVIYTGRRPSVIKYEDELKEDIY